MGDDSFFFVQFVCFVVISPLTYFLGALSVLGGSILRILPLHFGHPRRHASLQHIQRHGPAS